MAREAKRQLATTENAKKQPSSEVRREMFETFFLILPEVWGTTLLLLAVAWSHKLLGWLIGEQATFFGVLPVSWIFDAGDIAVILAMLYRSIKKFTG